MNVIGFFYMDSNNLLLENIKITIFRNNTIIILKTWKPLLNSS